MLHPFERSVLHSALALLTPGARVVVAVSGGGDSTALLLALAAVRAQLPLELSVACLDHGWRSASEGAAEREHVAALASSLGLPCDAERVAAGSLDGSREAGARRARYDFLARVAAARGARAVALGHTREDQVETVLGRILRGTSLRGLGGMPARRRLSRRAACVWVVRPLLELGREEARAYLRARGVSWREDPSNADTSLARNRLRRHVLPLLRELSNPRVDEALLRLARHARGASAPLERAAEDLLAGDRLAGDLLAGDLLASDRDPGADLGALRAAPAPVRAAALARLAQGAAPGRVEERHVRGLERLVAAGRGALALPGGGRASVSGARLVVARRERARDASPAAAPSLPLPLGIPGEVWDRVAGLRFSARLLPAPPGELRADPARLALLDADRVQGALAVRRRRPGDRFWPLGAPGRRTLKRFLIDQRVPRTSRGAIPVVTIDDRPLWVVGHRIDDQFKVTPSTARVLELRASAASGEEQVT
ncbi:MAG: tRNA lysidine(34) synthetase TilS [Planctomycetota bacterium]